MLCAESVADLHRLALPLYSLRSESFSMGYDAHLAWFGKTTHKGTIHSTLNWKSCRKHTVAITLSNSATPLGRAFETERHVAVVERTASAFLVNYFESDECHICPVGTHAIGCSLKRETERSSFTYCLKCVFRHGFALLIVRHGTECAWFVCHGVEREKEIVFTFCHTYRFSIEEKLYMVGIRHHIDGFDGCVRIVPVAHDVGLRSFGQYPSVPHHLVGKVGILWQTHCIADSAGAVV